MATLEQLSAALIKADAAGNVDDARAFAAEIRKMQTAPVAEPETTLGQDIKQGAGNVLSGLVRGAGSIGSTLLAPRDALENLLYRKGGVPELQIQDRRPAMDAGLKSMGAEPDSWMYKGGKLGGEIAGTLGMGGALANAGARVPLLASKAAPLLEAVRTGGMSAGGMSGLPGLGVRAAGGALTGAASAGAVNPEDAGLGAAIGGAFPVAAKLAGEAGGAIGRGVKSIMTPQQQAMVAQVAKLTGKSNKEVLQALQKQGPNIIDVKPTVPQILQDDAISQLQRSVINAGDKSIMQREALQNADRLQAFNRVAPVFDTVNEAADNAGAMIGNFGKSARANESENVRRLFDAVDPFGDTAINLPIEAMKASKAKFLGPGTFGKGSAASTAIGTAEDVGTQILPGVKELTKKEVGKQQSLEQAVRAAGGIRGSSGELRDLGIKQSGTTGLVNSKTGRPVDLLAEQMHRRGFIPDNDPATLLDMLRNGGGRKVFAHDATEGGMQRAMESAMGEAPDAMRIAKPVPFQTVQNLRGSLNEAWKDASMRGRNQEAAALKGMISDIDNKVSKVAGGRGDAGEAFPADIVQSWQDALAAHASKKARFDTGPQARMFRQGGDGQSAIQGAEIPREFFNSRASQIEDMQAFGRLTKANPELSRALKSYAMTDAAGQTKASGMLSADKLSKWVKNRHGALKDLMSEQDLALLKTIVKDVKQAESAATRGMAVGSNTRQNQEASARLLANGLLDNPATNILFNRIPVVGNFTGPMLEGLRKSSKASKAEKLGGLLADPELFQQELAKYITRNQQVPGLLSNSALLPLMYQANPALARGLLSGQ